MIKSNVQSELNYTLIVKQSKDDYLYNNIQSDQGYIKRDK